MKNLTMKDYSAKCCSIGEVLRKMLVAGSAAKRRCTCYHFAPQLYLLPFCAALFLLASCGNPLVNESVIGVTYYDVAFNTDGGAFADTFAAVQTVEKGKTVTRPPALEKEGFTFGGWFTDSDFENEWNFHMLVLKNLTLFAKWDKIHNVVYYTVYLWDGNELLVEWEAAAQTHINPPELPRKIGYNFVQWNTMELGAEGELVPQKWKFKDEEGENGEKADLLDPESGRLTWNSDPNIENWELHLYLQWDPIEYSVEYFPNDIDINGNALAETPSGDMEPTPERRYDDGVPLPAVEFAITGYTFTGWNTEPDGSGVSWGVEAIGNLTDKDIGDEDYEPVLLYAQWAANLHMVTFDPMGGNWGQAPNGETFIDIQYLPNNQFQDTWYNGRIPEPEQPVRELPVGLYEGSIDGTYTFVGWFRDRDYTVPWNFDSDTLPDEDITLYAKWEAENLISWLYDVEQMQGFGYYSNTIAWALEYINQNKGIYTLLLDEDVIADVYAYIFYSGMFNIAFAVETGVSLTLVGSGVERKIRLKNPGTLFTVNGGELILGRNITLEGITLGVNGAAVHNNAPMVWVNNEGKCTMLDGSKITGNTVDAGVTTRIDAPGFGGSAADMYASAVLIEMGTYGFVSELVIKGGQITGNYVHNGPSDNTGSVVACPRSQVQIEGNSIVDSVYLWSIQALFSRLSVLNNACIGDVTINGTCDYRIADDWTGTIDTENGLPFQRP